jgi:hypothetical protein
MFNFLYLIIKQTVMKAFKFFCCFVLLFFLGYSVSAQDNIEEKLNLPGDNLNLYAVMKLFQESETLEGFEKNLNAEDSKINNLDLNGDDKIDYIKVIDNVNGSDHTIVLQVAVNERENQDVAVFTVQKDADNNVQIQLVGDEELYGKDYIIEPNYADNASAGATPNPGYTGNSRNVNGENVVVTKTTYVEVASWPLISYLFLPSYIAWHSPWYWGYYPSYWNPWHPYYWDYYYGYHSHWNHYYYGHYRPWHNYRYAHWNDHYYNTHRSYSNTVYQRRQSGLYKDTYSRPDMRQQGSADYVKRYPANRDGSKSRNIPNEGANRQGSKSGVNQPTERRGDNKPDVRQGTNEPRNRQGVGNQGARRDENKPEIRSGENKRSERPANNRPSVRSENKRSEPRQQKTNRSSETKKTERSSDKKTERRK